MELTLEGVTSMEVGGGHVTIELPAYMHALNEREFQLARSCNDKLERILAAGRHPTSGNLVFITGAGDIREMDFDEVFESHGITAKDFRPRPGGSSVSVEFNEIDIVNPIDLESSWCISQSQLMISLSASLAGKSNVRVTYLDDEVDTATTAPTDS